METLIIAGVILFVVLLTLYMGIKVVPQSNVYVVERFGKYLSLIHI